MSSYAVWKPRPVFVTSTFTDMQAERDYLRDHVFPELEQRLKERFCHLRAIDLGWVGGFCSIFGVNMEETR